MRSIVPRDEFGRFPRGVSGNPSGRTVGISRELTVLAQTHCPNAIHVLASIANDPSAPHASRIYAANSLLDRGLGKVRDMSRTELGDEPITLELDAIDAGL
jgi:hypothetical protein